jgi:hypothetical protein
VINIAAKVKITWEPLVHFPKITLLAVVVIPRHDWSAEEELFSSNPIFWCVQNASVVQSPCLSPPPPHTHARARAHVLLPHRSPVTVTGVQIWQVVPVPNRAGNRSVWKWTACALHHLLLFGAITIYSYICVFLRFDLSAFWFACISSRNAICFSVSLSIRIVTQEVTPCVKTYVNVCPCLQHVNINVIENRFEYYLYTVSGGSACVYRLFCYVW